MSAKLDKYRSMRDPDKTPEPFTSDDRHPDKLHFVVQKHQATALHYDFRLEVDGVMPSWPIPKGPSLDNTVKRLALKTEDHPLDYRHFEGVIPEGEYGGGPVIIWDEGYYYPEVEIEKGVRQQIKDKAEGEKVMEAAIEKGEVKFYLHGKRLKGSFALIKTKGFGPKNAWLMIKHKDDECVEGYDAAKFTDSVKSGKTLEDLTA